LQIAELQDYRKGSLRYPPNPSRPAILQSHDHLFVRKHSRQLRRVGIVDGRGSPQLALPLSGFAGQDVLLERAAAKKLSALRAFEALRGAAMSFEFWHM
jgi:hypothetical protein